MRPSWKYRVDNLHCEHWIVRMYSHTRDGGLGVYALSRLSEAWIPVEHVTSRTATHKQTYLSYIHTYGHTYMYTQAHIHVHTHTHTHARTHTDTQTHTHAHTRTHTHAHTHTRTHTMYHVYARRKRSTQICKCTGCAPTDFLFIATIADLILIETDQDKRQITV